MSFIRLRILNVRVESLLANHTRLQRKLVGMDTSTEDNLNPHGLCLKDLKKWVREQEGQQWPKPSVVLERPRDL